MKEFELALGYDDIQVLPNFSDVNSRKDVDTETILAREIVLKYGVILSPMDSVSTTKSCIELNKIGAAGILHRFMSINDQFVGCQSIKTESGRSFCAISLKDYKERIPALIKAGADVLFLDSANGLSRNVFDFTKWYCNDSGYKIPLITGNTLTKQSVSRLINFGAAGVRHCIGTGAACKTTLQSAIGCPSITSIYYAYKAIRNWQLYNNDWQLKNTLSPSILVDGGIRKPADYCKAVLAGADAIICGKLLAGCYENSEEIIEKDGQKWVKYRGMASQEVVEEYGLSDGTKENLFDEGESYLVKYQDKSVKDVVFELNNGLRSCMSYLGFKNIDEIKGALWTDKVKAVRISPNSLYESTPHGKGS